jgi:hypothetical protein
MGKMMERAGVFAFAIGFLAVVIGAAFALGYIVGKLLI